MIVTSSISSDIHEVREWKLQQPLDKHYFNARKLWKKQQVSSTQCHRNIWALNLMLEHTVNLWMPRPTKDYSLYRWNPPESNWNVWSLCHLAHHHMCRCVLRSHSQLLEHDQSWTQSRLLRSRTCKYIKADRMTPKHETNGM